MWGEFRVDDEGVKESTGGEVPPPAVRHKLHHQPFFHIHCPLCTTAAASTPRYWPAGLRGVEGDGEEEAKFELALSVCG